MRRISLRAVLHVGLALAVCMGAAPSANAASCNRSCLKSFIDQYLAAMIAHDPSKLPLAKNARFTEDTLEKKVGEGLWTTASKLRTYRQDFLDVRAGVAGSHVVLEEGSTPILFVLRLKIADKKISEVETMTVRNQKEGAFFEIDALQTASDAMTIVPNHKQLEKRDNAIKIAAHYPDGLKAGSFVAVNAPFAADAYRFENGRRMAGPGCVFQPPGCEDLRAQKIPKLSALTYRLAAVDEELGIVWFRLNFGPGSIGPKDKALIVWEAFKVYDGKMHAVEAFMKVMPADAGSGWD